MSTIRDNSVNLFNTITNIDTAREKEQEIFNSTLKEAITQDITRNWHEKAFLSIYDKKCLRAYIELNTKMKRQDLLSLFMFNFTYDEIMNEFKQIKGDSIAGFVFETISIIALPYLYYFEKLSESNISDNTLKWMDSYNTELHKSISNGNNKSDITFKQGECTIPTSIKYKGHKSETDLSKLDSIMKKKNIPYKLALIVKDKQIYINHRYNHREDIDKCLIDDCKKNDLLRDEDDVREAWTLLRNRLNAVGLLIDNTHIHEHAEFKYSYTICPDVKNIMEFMKVEYLNTKRIPLKLRLHQAIATETFKDNLKLREFRHIISHKPRSGKTITILAIVLYLLMNVNHKRILIMTSVKDTIDDFIKKGLNKYIDFRKINYKTQEEFLSCPLDFEGIMFCSVQYLKKEKKAKTETKDTEVDSQKLKKLKELNFGTLIFDEAHHGTSTYKTYEQIVNVYSDKQVVQVFASGTSRKTEEFYGIKEKCIYRWTVEDEAEMKELYM